MSESNQGGGASRGPPAATAGGGEKKQEKCGWTKPELIGLKKEIKADKLDYKDHFFKASNRAEVPSKHKGRDDFNDLCDELDRCLKCGRTIDEHPAQAQPQQPGYGYPPQQPGCDHPADVHQMSEHQQQTLVTMIGDVVRQILREERIADLLRGPCIGSLPDVSEKSIDVQDKTKAHDYFSSKCLVTHVPKCEAPYDKPHKLAHIVPKKIKNQVVLAAQYNFNVDQVNEHSNLLFVSWKVEYALDHFGLCFTPTNDGTFKVVTPGSRPEGWSEFVDIPDHVSRKSLMIHALDYHKHHGITAEFNVESWRGLPKIRSKSTDLLVSQWLASTATATGGGGGAELVEELVGSEKKEEESGPPLQERDEKEDKE